MIEKRKSQHIEICLKENVQASYNYWDDIHLIHQALPEVNKNAIDLSIEIFGKKLNAPIIISGMTGGTPYAKKINENLAKASAVLKIGFGVGSQRPALEDRKLEDTYSIVKTFEIPLVIANIGAPQLVSQGNKRILNIEDCKRAMEMINAHVLAIHLNFLQEVIQPEGDTNAHGVLDSIKVISSKLPTIAKETGAGISKRNATRLKNTGIIGIDVGGLSGTSFSAVEYYRAKAINDELRMRLGKLFWNWGIPTPVSIVEAKGKIPIIATGGIRNGLDVVKSLVLGASCGGIAQRLLKPATKNVEETIRELKAIIEEIRCTMFLLGVEKISDLKERSAVITGQTVEWLKM